MAQVVPTEYRYLSKDVLSTNQYSVTEYYTPMNEFDRTWPGWSNKLSFPICTWVLITLFLFLDDIFYTAFFSCLLLV